MSLEPEYRQAVIDYRLEKSDISMQQARMCADNGHWSLAVQRLYYAAYYVVTALLLKHGCSIKTHAGAATMLSQKFVLTGLLPKETGRTYSRLFKMRQTGDYDDCFDYDEDDVAPYFDKTNALIDAVKTLL